MFYYRIKVTREHGVTRTTTREFREALRTEDIGDTVTNHFKHRSVQAVSVIRINQAAYIVARGD